MRVAVVASYADSLLLFRGPLIEALVAAGHEVHACAPRASSAVVEGLRALGARTHDYPLDRASLSPRADLGSAAALARIFRDLRPDVVLSYTIKPVVYGALAARLSGVPASYAMITGLGHAFIPRAGWRALGLRALVSAMYAAALRQSAGIFFQNPDDRDDFRRRSLLPPGVPVTVLHGSGVDLDRFAPAPPVTDPVAFLLVGRLLAEKGVREYVEAARIVRRERPLARFHLVGPLDPNPSCIGAGEAGHWEREGVVSYHGPTGDVRPFLARASVFVLPSYREGTPRAVLEAMAMGRPVITTDVPGCRETVVDGDNGFLVPARDPGALARAMIRFVDRPHLIRSMGARGRVIAEETFDARQVARVMMDAMGLGRPAEGRGERNAKAQRRKGAKRRRGQGSEPIFSGLFAPLRLCAFALNSPPSGGTP
jgi:glycosyltransferase involved in cell wall biosynthesis